MTISDTATDDCGYRASAEPSPTGYERHRKAGETPCAYCRAQAAAYKRHKRHGTTAPPSTDRPTIAEDLAAGPLPELSADYLAQLIAEDLMAGGPAVDLVASLLERPAWMADALCHEYPEVNFHPRRGEPTAPAKAVCARCAVAEECLRYVLEVESFRAPQGIWGGTTGRERKALRWMDDAELEHYIAKHLARCRPTTLAS